MAQGPEQVGACRNCGAPVAARYCPECGQETSLHPLSVLDFAREIASHYVAAEGKLWHTLALLLFQPGRLTVEFLAGRRRRYIAPIRLYLTASFLFFAVAQLNGQFVSASVVGHVTAAPALASTAARAPVLELDLSDLKQIREEQFADCLKPGASCPWWKRQVAPSMIKLQDDPQVFVDRFAERFGHALSYAVFLLLPLFALLLALAYRNRGMFYGEHLIFALHVHSFWFLLALLAVLLPNSIGDWLRLVSLVYGVWALHRVYAGRWRYTLIRGSAIAATYLVMLGLGAALLSAVLFST
jgi:Protein of unknown function (DUF3667)